ncbi:hypothetical protein MIND_01335000 [Mycena indigotica]|uniref:Uncharacterized protein n=1 Tax=Mycena indigotica TaxID=2126181 RepID=A0A8H6S2Q2_9AGAR|nr:uncharacterized protein MIND_01335000 [Mycena indigotica]KAF7290215.1 hypothetical protein MIND_01335000 [Mycena indigotica]
MDAGAVNVNVTADDFDSILTYADQGSWTTPDPSSKAFSAAGSPWLMGTFHSTDVVGAGVSMNFTGPAVTIVGASGPEYGSVEVVLDGQATVHSAYATSNASAPYILYSTASLAYAPHTLTLRNLGKQGSDAGGNRFLLDFVRTVVQVAPAGATVTNQTLEETDPRIKYSGTWGNNKSPNFGGGGTTFTNDDNASFELEFSASAIYVFGDKKNDHGLYTVTLDSQPAQTLSGISGCGGAFGMTCEQQAPTLKYFASNLAAGTHKITLTNRAGVNQSFFDLDSIVLTVPSVFAPRNSSADGSHSSAHGSASSSAPLAHQSTSHALPTAGLPSFIHLFLFVFLCAHIVRHH